MGGYTKNSKDSAGRRLGLKTTHGSEVLENEIILRQRGFKWHPGNNIKHGKDHTLHTKMEGKVVWANDRYAYKKRKRVNVIPMEIPNRKFPAPFGFMYHPELYPELAGFNPEPTNLELPIRKKVRTMNP